MCLLNTIFSKFIFFFTLVKMNNITAEMYLRESLARFESGEFELARQSCDCALGLNNNSDAVKSVIHSSRALCFAEVGQIEFAAVDATVAITMNPDNNEAYLVLIKMRIRQGRFGEAHRLIDENRDRLQAYSAFASLRRQLNSLEITFQQYEKLMSRGQHSLALAKLNVFLNSGIVDPFYRFLKAECLIELNKIQEASEILRTLLLP